MFTSLVLLATACTPYVPGLFNQGVEPLLPNQDTAATDASDTDDLSGAWLTEPIEPLEFFVAADLDDRGRGASHLYRDRPTLLVQLDADRSILETLSDDLAVRLADDLFLFEAARVNVVVLRSANDGHGNATWAAELELGALDVWEDLDSALSHHYAPLDRSPRWAWLIDPHGQAVLAYDRSPLDEQWFTDDVVDDALTLWGAR